MKKCIILLFVLALIGFGSGIRDASAATIVVDPNPTDFFHVGGFALPNTTTDDVYNFTLTRQASYNFSITTSATAAGGWYSLTDDHGVTPLTSILAANTNYILHLFLTANLTDAAFYAGTVDFIATTTTPLPPSVLMFMTAVAGLTVAGWRRRVASQRSAA